MQDRVIVITGGAKGIGAAIARACGEEGARPVIVDRDAEAGQQLQNELRSQGISCHSISVELSQPAQCLEAVQQSWQAFGQIDALVNNAGLNDKIGLENGSPQEFLDSLNRNLVHYYCLAHYALPYLKRSRGSILNVGSKTAVTGQGGTSGYASAKGGVMALTREWAVELLPYGIRVNSIIPSEVITPAYRAWLDTFPDPEQKMSGILAKIPLGKRMTQPQEIAATAVFLLSGKSSHTTGQHVFVDGGYVHLDRSVT